MLGPRGSGSMSRFRVTPIMLKGSGSMRRFRVMPGDAQGKRFNEPLSGVGERVCLLLLPIVPCRLHGGIWQQHGRADWAADYAAEVASRAAAAQSAGEDARSEQTDRGPPGAESERTERGPPELLPEGARSGQTDRGPPDAESEQTDRGPPEGEAFALNGEHCADSAGARMRNRQDNCASEMLPCDACI